MFQNGGDEEKGLYSKYEVTRLVDEGQKHKDCRYFVLDPQHDPIARLALRKYADLARDNGYKLLADDLDELIQRTAT